MMVPSELIDTTTYEVLFRIYGLHLQKDTIIFNEYP